MSAFLTFFLRFFLPSFTSFLPPFPKTGITPAFISVPRPLSCDIPQSLCLPVLLNLPLFSCSTAASNQRFLRSNQIFFSHFYVLIEKLENRVIITFCFDITPKNCKFQLFFAIFNMQPLLTTPFTPLQYFILSFHS